MSITHLKRASRKPADTTNEAREVVERMLGEISTRGEAAVRDYALSLDHWSGEIIVPPAEITRRIAEVPTSIREDIDFAVDRVRRFALAQGGVQRGNQFRLLGIARLCCIQIGSQACHLRAQFFGPFLFQPKRICQIGHLRSQGRKLVILGGDRVAQHRLHHGENGQYEHQHHQQNSHGIHKAGPYHGAVAFWAQCHCLMPFRLYRARAAPP